MLNHEQEQIVIQYLLDKKLSLDIAAEVFDHMVSQITSLQDEHQLTFEEAWMATKSSWLQDLKMTYDVRYSFDDISQIMKTVTHKRWKQDVVKILPAVLLMTIFLDIIFVNISSEQVRYFQIGYGILYVLFVVVALFMNKKHRKLFKKFQQNPVLIGTNWGFLAVSSSGLVSVIFQSANWDMFHQEFSNMLKGHWSTKSIFTVLYFNSLILFLSFLIQSSFQYYKRLKKTLVQIQPFLEKLQ